MALNSKRNRRRVGWGKMEQRWWYKEMFSSFKQAAEEAFQFMEEQHSAYDKFPLKWWKHTFRQFLFSFRGPMESITEEFLYDQFPQYQIDRIHAHIEWLVRHYVEKRTRRIMTATKQSDK